jgi:two-component system, cell cycle sensor histidine kinase and response regulator CckA
MKVLHLEDSSQDAELVAALLRAQAPDIQIFLVNTRKEFLSVLTKGGIDVILSDFNLPGFSGYDALKLAQEREPDLPFIFVSGTVGEDTAVELIRRGAADYLLKDHMQRLPLAIQRARKDREERLERRRAEELIREQAELLNKTRDGMIVTNLSYDIIYWNRGAERLFGWTADEVIGQNALTLFGGGVEASIRAMEKRLAGDEEWRGEIWVDDKEGNSLLVEVRVTIIRDSAGLPKSHLSIIEDITERRKLEEQFLHAQRLESLGMLATGIAHDLNNALAPMLMAGEILRMRVTDPGDVKLLDLLGQGGQRSAALIKQIISFADGGGREQVLVQTKHLLRDIFVLMQETFPKSIRVEDAVPDGLWTVQSNPSQLHQAVLNLCINARDAMPQGGVLRLSAHNQTLTEKDAKGIVGGTPGQFLVIEVADTGSGVPSFVLEHIWQPFFTAKGEGKGTGLGLSAVRGIAVSHGGFVNADSEKGRGSTFRIFIPAADTEAGTPAPGSLAPFMGNSHGELILVVDDEEGIRESVSAILRRTGYRALATSGGIEALAQYAGRIQEVSLVITDLDMPGLGGKAFSKAILHLNPTIKILFISGAEEDSGLPVATKGGSAFLAKPFTSEELLLKVQTLLLRPGGKAAEATPPSP